MVVLETCGIRKLSDSVETKTTPEMIEPCPTLQVCTKCQGFMGIKSILYTVDHFKFTSTTFREFLEKSHFSLFVKS